MGTYLLVARQNLADVRNEPTRTLRYDGEPTEQQRIIEAAFSDVVTRSSPGRTTQRTVGPVTTTQTSPGRTSTKNAGQQSSTTNRGPRESTTQGGQRQNQVTNQEDIGVTVQFAFTVQSKKSLRLIDLPA